MDERTNRYRVLHPGEPWSMSYADRQLAGLRVLFRDDAGLLNKAITGGPDAVVKTVGLVRAVIEYHGATAGRAVLQDMAVEAVPSVGVNLARVSGLVNRRQLSPMLADKHRDRYREAAGLPRRGDAVAAPARRRRR